MGAIYFVAFAIMLIYLATEIGCLRGRVKKLENAAPKLEEGGNTAVLAKLRKEADEAFRDSENGTFRHSWATGIFHALNELKASTLPCGAPNSPSLVICQKIVEDIINYLIRSQIVFKCDYTVHRDNILRIIIGKLQA